MQAKKNYTLLEIAKAYYKHMGGMKKLLPIHGGIVLVNGYMQAMVPAVAGYIINALIKDAKGFVDKELPWMFAALVLATVFFYIIDFWLNFLTIKFSRVVGVRFQLSLYRHLQQLSTDFYQGTQVGEITSRLTNDISGGVIPLYPQLHTILWTLSLIVPSCIMLAMMSTTLFMCFVFVSVSFVSIGRSFFPLIKRLNREAQDEFGKINARMTEDVSANSLIRAFAQENVVERQMSEHAEIFLAKSLKMGRVTMLVTSIFHSITEIIAPIVILLVGAHLVVGEGISVGALVAAYGYWKTCAQPIGALMNNCTVIFGSLASMERVMDFFNLTAQVKDKKDAKELNLISGEVELKDVLFRYPLADGEVVLDGMNLKAEGKKSLALVGESGAGKSTIIQLIMRLYDPETGTVLIDGQDPKDLTQKSIRENIGLVMQETILLSGTVRQNMAFAKTDAKDEEIIDALINAEAWDFVKSMPHGLNTVLGERGMRLSGGQKQRLAIARVFLRNPPIVIFDEATSALDTLTEKLIQKSMARLFKNRTALVIAHRLSTIVGCDQIAVIRKGKVLDMGEHEELLVRCDSYREMCEQQSLKKE